MKNLIRFIWAILSFCLPLVGISLYFTYKNKRDAKVYGIMGVIGIFVYIGISMGYI